MTGWRPNKLEDWQNIPEEKRINYDWQKELKQKGFSGFLQEERVQVGHLCLYKQDSQTQKQ